MFLESSVSPRIPSLWNPNNFCATLECLAWHIIVVVVGVVVVGGVLVVAVGVGVVVVGCLLLLFVEVTKGSAAPSKRGWAVSGTLQVGNSDYKTR